MQLALIHTLFDGRAAPLGIRRRDRGRHVLEVVGVGNALLKHRHLRGRDLPLVRHRHTVSLQVRPDELRLVRDLLRNLLRNLFFPLGLEELVVDPYVRRLFHLVLSYLHRGGLFEEIVLVVVAHEDQVVDEPV